MTHHLSKLSASHNRFIVLTWVWWLHIKWNKMKRMKPDKYLILTTWFKWIRKLIWHFYNISSISQKLSHALYAGSMSLYTGCQECHASFSSLVTDVKFLSSTTSNIYTCCLPHVYPMFPWWLYWNIKYDHIWHLWD